VGGIDELDARCCEVSDVEICDHEIVRECRGGNQAVFDQHCSAGCPTVGQELDGGGLIGSR